jgi:ribonuclease P protein component
MALNKKNRLKKKKDFERVFKQGKAVKGNFLFAKYISNDLGFPRFAFIVSSKVSGKAVVRNRVRRAVSEASRLKLKEFHPADIIFIAAKPIVQAPREDIEKEVSAILKRIK